MVVVAWKNVVVVIENMQYLRINIHKNVFFDSLYKFLSCFCMALNLIYYLCGLQF